MVPVPSLVLIPHCELDVLVASSGTAIGVLLEMKEREGSEEDLRDLTSLPTHPRRVLKAVYMLLFHVTTGSCHPLRRKMLSLYVIPVSMANVIRLMVKPMRKLDMGIKSSSCAGWGDLRIDHGEAGSTLLMDEGEREG